MDHGLEIIISRKPPATAWRFGGYRPTARFRISTGDGQPWKQVGLPNLPAQGFVSVRTKDFQTGLDVDITGTGFKPGGVVHVKYYGIPGRSAPLCAGIFDTVRPDGSFEIVDNSQEKSLVGNCSISQYNGVVTVGVSETDLNGTEIATGSGEVPAWHWCAYYPR